MSNPIALIPGRVQKMPGLLARYLPLLPEGIASTWLQDHLPPGSWVFDPFGASPQLDIEAARAGYRVFVRAKNPITRFLLEISANPPTEADLRNVLANLASLRKGKERLEPHLKNLYLTTCEQCGQELMAEAFLWKRGASAPYGRVYNCPNCKDSGEHTATPADIARAERFATGGLHHARALERIAPLFKKDSDQAREALSSYLPRAVYALFTLINKLESFPNYTTLESPPSSSQLQCITALLLSAFDRANTLWPYPTARARPRKITIPPRFRENNIWLALEEAVDQINYSTTGVPLTIWPESPPSSGGLVLYEGRWKDLILDRVSTNVPQFAAVLAAIPRPNQAFWTLSAMWASWIWGRDSIIHFKSVIHRRRYDWVWYCNALSVVLSNLTPLLSNKIKFLGLIGEAEPGFLSAALLGANASGYKLNGLALRTDQELVQITWEYSSKNDTPRYFQDIHIPNQDIIRQAAISYVQERGEPAEYLHLHTAALTSIIKTSAQLSNKENSLGDRFSLFQENLEETLTNRDCFQRFWGSESSLEVGQWWLSEGYIKTEVAVPLADRVEIFLSHYLQTNITCSLSEIDSIVCTSSPGLFTPDFELIKACLESYCEPDPLNGDLWRLRPQDYLKARSTEIVAMRNHLEKLGQSMGFTIQGDNPLTWHGKNGLIAYAFYIIYSASIGKFVYSSPFPPSQTLIVIPGGRANLAAYKLRHNARLQEEIIKGWRFLKFRHLRRFVDTSLINRENLDEQFSLDPLMESDPQLRLL